jgi:hypothetical protein
MSTIFEGFDINEAFLVVQQATLNELKGRFTKNEILAICDNLNGTLLVPNYQHQAAFFWANLNEGNQLDGLFEKWELDAIGFETKVLSLTAAQCFFIQQAVVQSWETNTDTSDTNEKFKTLLEQLV